jgi:hypothetical protein
MKFNFCVVCGESLIIHQHHFIPRSMGGGDEDTNMLSLCPTHHYWLHKMMYSNTNRKKVEKVKQTLSKEELQKLQEEGVEFAKKQGVKCGRKREYTYNQAREVLSLRKGGNGYGTISKKMNLSESMVRRIISKTDEFSPPPGGRPKISQEMEDKIISLYNEEKSYRAIRRETGVALATIRRVVVDNNLPSRI